MLSLPVEAGKLLSKPQFPMLADNNVRQAFLKHRDFLSLMQSAGSSTVTGGVVLFERLE